MLNIKAICVPELKYFNFNDLKNGRGQNSTQIQLNSTQIQLKQIMSLFFNRL